VGVQQPAQRAGQADAVVDVRAVGIAQAVGERVVLSGSATQEMAGPSIAAEPRTARTARTAGAALKLRCVNSR
jgi:hypothetical protein